MKSSAPSRSERLVRRLLLAGMIVGILIVGVSEVIYTLRHQPAGIDFAPLWTAARLAVTTPSRIYDFAKITGLQEWFLRGYFGSRPFAYPPSALLVLSPFAAAPFAWAYGLWVLATGAFMAWANARLCPQRPWLAVLLSLLATPNFTVIDTGQTTFLIAGLVALAIPEANRRPWLAGTLLAFAALIKPTTLILAPFALLSGGHWRALGWSVVVGLAGVAVSALVFGVPTWLDWISAVPRFQRLIENPYMLPAAITPSGAAIAFVLRGLPLLAVRLLCVLFSAGVIWRVWRNTGDSAVRIAVLLGGGILAAPYALQYDAALLAPAAAATMIATLDRPDWMRGLAGILLLTAAGIPHAGAFAIIAVVPVLAWPGLGIDYSGFLRRQPSVSMT